MSWAFLFLTDSGFLGLILAVFFLAMLTGFPMFLLQFLSGGKWKFFGLEPGEAIYNKNRRI